jgi:CheY-like chemotaxis protein
MSDQSNPATAPTPSPTPSLPPPTALIVDDNFYNRQIFQMALESVGYKIKESEDGVQGINVLKNETFDLLVLDLQMPEMDGRAVLKAVREQDMHRKMRILVITANAHMAMGDVDDLADYIMFKPINVVEFSEFARRLKDSRTTAISSNGTTS